ncbi:PREDICTED: protein MCM10 homolog [Branchiostoma belcheri]|uniref:Protein MCM10 homolog n=1 Tax=Branchiostoma belcheri TaxID=7741 RepID=A0A6P4ZJS7_BRABE|nr:PREDICTED: protein MCM10 homolog [Branchiostoma belcheri]
MAPRALCMTGWGGQGSRCTAGGRFARVFACQSSNIIFHINFVRLRKIAHISLETDRPAPEMDSDDDYPMDYGLDALTSLMDEDDFGNVFDRDEENAAENDKPPTPPPKLSFEDALAGPSEPHHSKRKVKRTSKEHENKTSTNRKSTDGEKERQGSRKSTKQDTDRTSQGGHGDTEDDEANRSKEDLEEELRQMREKMMMLEQQLKKQKSQDETSPTVTKKSTPVNPYPSPPQSRPQKTKTESQNRLDFLTGPAKSPSPSQRSEEEPKRNGDRLSFLKGDPSVAASTPKQKVKTSPKKKSPTESFYSNGGGKKRVAHQPKQERGDGESHETGTPRPLGLSVKHNRNPTTGVKRELSPSADTLAPKRTKLLESDPVLVDKYSQIRILNPKISSETLRTKMEGRKMVRMSVIKSHMRNGEIEGDWVTMGVLVKKIPPKTSSNGKTFSIWKLSDLRDCSMTVSFFLFGDVHKNHWKNDEGTVLGLCNPSIMKARDKGDTDVALTVDNPLKVMVMGRSKDLGYCKATKKAGGQCENFVNRDQCEYCEYHVHSQYKKSKAKRGEFNSVIGPPDPKKKMLQKMMGKNESFMYGGHTYTTSSPAATANKKKTQVNLDFLRVAGARSMDAAVKANIVGKMEKKKDEETLKKLAAPSQAMQELLCAPTVGSMNLIKHLGTEEKKAQPKVKPVSASELLKSHKQEMLEMRKKQQANRQPSQAQASAAGSSPETFYPKLGKGLANSGDIVMFDSPSQKVSSSQKAMQRAIAKIKVKGPLTPDNPNAVKKKVSPKAQEAIKSKVEEASTSQGDTSSPPEEDKRKAKLFGEKMDKNSEEYKKLVQAKSSHSGALSEAQLEMQEKYFAELEKKEKMEDKMATISYVKCKIVSCKKCKYTYFSPSETCKTENHPLVWHEGVKRFFKCMNCSKRCISLQRYPKVACKNCGSSKFERTTMLADKKGPKLDSETLNLRGEDEMFLNKL